MNYIIDPFTNNKHSINSNYGMNLLKKYVAYYQKGGSGEATKTKAKTKAKASGSGSGSGATKTKATKTKAKAKAKASGSGSGSGATKTKAAKAKASGGGATKTKAKASGSGATKTKLVGPHICYIYKIKDKTIMLFGEVHARIRKNTKGLFYHKYVLYLLDKFKTENKCLDIYHEYEYPIAKLQEKDRSLPKSISNSCEVEYSASKQYIVWIDDFYKECIVNKKGVRLHSFDLRKIFDVKEQNNYILYNLFYAYVVGDTKYKDTFKILGHEEFDENNKMMVPEFLGIKTINGTYFDNKATIDPLRNSFIEKLNSSTFNEKFILNIIENLLGFNDDNLLLNAMFELLDKSQELNLMTVCFDTSKHTEAINIIHKQLKKTKFPNKNGFTTFLTDSFIEYFEHFPEEDDAISNLIEKSNQPLPLQKQNSYFKIKMITLIYLHILTDVYGFLRMVLSWSKEEPKLSRKSGCIGDNYEQKNIVFYGGGAHAYLLSIFLKRYYEMDPTIYENIGKNHLNDFPLDIL
jgi:hypothetical protein